MRDEDRIYRWVTEADLRRLEEAAIEVGFSRGAKAMREAAVKACEFASATECAHAIRALPVPEDKR